MVAVSYGVYVLRMTLIVNTGYFLRSKNKTFFVMK
jgi:hypothetical protein